MTADSQTIADRLFGPLPAIPPTFSTSSVIGAMIDSGSGISDLIFSPGRPPQVEKHGELTRRRRFASWPMLRAADTARARPRHHRRQPEALRALKEQGACDLSYSLPERAPLPRQRLPPARHLRHRHARHRVADSDARPSSSCRRRWPTSPTLKNGIVLVTGPTGSGKSTTLAAIIDLINESRADHILTIEDPIEFLHPHKKATVHQRELHSDTPTFALALRSALRQAPKVILVGEMRDRETIEIALTAAETGHLVFSTLHTIDAVQDRRAHRRHLRLGRSAGDPRPPGGVVPLLHVAAPRSEDGRRPHRRARDAEVDAAHPRLHGGGEGEGKTLLDAMRDGEMDGMQHFDGEIEKLVRAGVITLATALIYATNAGNLRLLIADVPDEEGIEDDALITYLTRHPQVRGACLHGPDEVRARAGPSIVRQPAWGARRVSGSRTRPRRRTSDGRARAGGAPRG